MIGNAILMQKDDMEREKKKKKENTGTLILSYTQSSSTVYQLLYDWH